MGLTLVHMIEGGHLDCSYGGFGEYRKRLALEAAGIDLPSMKGYGGEFDWPDHHLQPLRHLLEHSDCDGLLYAYECQALAPVMRAFRPHDWPAHLAAYHERLTALIVDVAENGGAIHFR